MTRTFLGIAALSALLGACDDSAAGGDPVGTWQRLREDGTVRDQYVFRPDGSLTFDEFKPDDPGTEDHITGTYTATDTTVVAVGTNARDGARSQVTFTYYANATQFATQALRPAGNHTGIVGVWTAAVKVEFPDEPARPAEAAFVNYQFRADGTFTATGITPGSTAAVTQQGTYVEETPGVFRVTPAGQTLGDTLQMIDEAALVFPTRIFQRREP